MARANVLAQALPVLAAPLLTRLYTPADIGTLALCVSVLSLGLATGTGRFDWLVPSARGDRTAAALLVLGSLVLATLSLTLLLTWALFKDFLPLGSDSLGPLAWLLPLALLGGGVQQLLQAWHVRSAELSVVARAKVAQSTATVGLSLGLALMPGRVAGAWDLLLALLVGTWLGLFTLWRRAAGLRPALGRLSWLAVVAAWRRHWRQAGWSTVASVANAASLAVVPVLLARHHSVGDVGHYALTSRLALGPIALVGAAVSQSFWAEAARLVRHDVPALVDLYRRSSIRLAWIALPVALLALAGPWYIGAVFGRDQWADAGWVLAACTPMLLGLAVASPLSHLAIHGKQHWQALWDLGRIVLVCVVIEAMGRAGHSLAWTVLALSTAMGIMYLVLIVLNLQALRMAGSR